MKKLKFKTFIGSQKLSPKLLEKGMEHENQNSKRKFFSGLILIIIGIALIIKGFDSQFSLVLKVFGIMESSLIDVSIGVFLCVIGGVLLMISGYKVKIT